MHRFFFFSKKFLVYIVLTISGLHARFEIHPGCIRLVKSGWADEDVGQEFSKSYNRTEKYKKFGPSLGNKLGHETLNSNTNSKNLRARDRPTLILS